MSVVGLLVDNDVYAQRIRHHFDQMFINQCFKWVISKAWIQQWSTKKKQKDLMACSLNIQYRIN